MPVTEPLKISRPKISDLELHPQNYHQGDVGAITESLSNLGQYRAIVVQKSRMRVCAGNHTVIAAKALGWDRIDAQLVDVTDEEALRILLADNRTAALGYDDPIAVVELLTELAGSETGLLGTGYDGNDLDLMLADASEALGEESDMNRSSLLDIADLSYGEPTHQPSEAEVWILSERHHLIVAEPHSGWSHFVEFLKDEALLCIYPDLYLTASDTAKTTSLVLVQPNTYLAGHLLDKHVSLFGEGSVRQLR